MTAGYWPIPRSLLSASKQGVAVLGPDRRVGRIYRLVEHDD